MPRDPPAAMPIVVVHMIAATMRRENSHPTRRAPDEAFATVNINARCHSAVHHIRTIDTAITLIGYYYYHNRIAEGADARRGRIYIAAAAAAITGCYYGTADGAGALGDRSTHIYLADTIYISAVSQPYLATTDGAGALGDRLTRIYLADAIYISAVSQPYLATTDGA